MLLVRHKLHLMMTSFPCDALISFSTSSTLSIVSTTMGFVALTSIASETSMSPKTIGVKVLLSPASVKLSAISGLSMIAITFSLSSLSMTSFFRVRSARQMYKQCKCTKKQGAELFP